MSSNRLDELFERKKEGILNVYFTAGHPTLESTGAIIKSLEKSGVDLIELGMPYSDPMADGPTIQDSSQKALANGMSVDKLFEQVAAVRETCQVPLLMMGYLNQMIQYGKEKFLAKAEKVGIDGLIIPDLPMNLYEKHYQDLFEKYNIRKTFLITPETSEERILKVSTLSKGFIYVVSKSSITGSSAEINADQKSYFKRIIDLKLPNPRLIGFGIHDKATYNVACQNANGAIIGSAFIRVLDRADDLDNAITTFIKSIR